MTKLSKPVSRTVETKFDGEVVVTLTQAGIYFRQKGRRNSYGPLGYGQLFLHAVKQEVKPCLK